MIAGAIPTGMSGPNFQGQTAGNLIGTPTLEGTYRFTLQATDGTGATDAETFAITVTAPRPLTILSGATDSCAATATRAFSITIA